MPKATGKKASAKKASTIKKVYGKSAGKKKA
jgi:hypothetical protein